MSRISDLVAELCPAGVPFRPVGRLAHIASQRVAGGSLDTSTYVGVDNLLPDFGGRRDSTYLSGSGSAIAFRPGDVLVGNIRPYLRKVWLADRHGGASPDVVTLSLLPGAEAELLPAFLYCLIASEPFINYYSQHARGGKMPRGDKAAILAYRIPVPPVEVQAEVLRTLNAFRDLDASLRSELKLREIQQNHYLERLMRFPDDVPRDPMVRAGTFVRGKRFTKADYVADGGLGCIHYGEIYTHYGASATSVISRLREDLEPSLRFAQSGDVVIATVGETVEDVAKAVAWLGEEPVAIHDDSCLFRSRMNPKFVSYWMQTQAFHSQKERFVARGKVNRISAHGLEQILIPMPSTDEQTRVVRVLDAFDSLLATGDGALAAEIRGRQRQHEHYRDMLLRFNEVVA